MSVPNVIWAVIAASCFASALTLAHGIVTAHRYDGDIDTEEVTL